MRNILAGILIALVPCLAVAAAGDLPAANAPSLQSEKRVGDAAQPGLYILRQHLPAGGFVRPHFHDMDRHVAVLSGVLYVCNSATVSVAGTTAHRAGDVFTEPAKSIHCSWAKDGDVDYLEIGIGPVTTTFAEK